MCVFVCMYVIVCACNRRVQLHLALAVAEHAAAQRHHDPELPRAASEVRIAASDFALNGERLSRSGSRRSLPEFIYPDTIRQRVTSDECPVCQIMLPKGPGGCVRPTLSFMLS